MEWVIIIIAAVIWLNYKKDKESKQNAIKQVDKGTMQCESEKDRIYFVEEKGQPVGRRGAGWGAII